MIIPCYRTVTIANGARHIDSVVALVDARVSAPWRRFRDDFARHVSAAYGHDRHPQLRVVVSALGDDAVVAEIGSLTGPPASLDDVNSMMQAFASEVLAPAASDLGLPCRIEPAYRDLFSLAAPHRTEPGSTLAVDLVGWVQFVAWAAAPTCPPARSTWRVDWWRQGGHSRKPES